jgi:hypothetical protein
VTVFDSTEAVGMQNIYFYVNSPKSSSAKNLVLLMHLINLALYQQLIFSLEKKHDNMRNKINIQCFQKMFEKANSEVRY